MAVLYPSIPQIPLQIKKLMRWHCGSLEVNDSPRGWVSYKLHPLRVSDYNIPGGSPGYSTGQRLLKLGYIFEQTDSGFGD